MRIIFSEICFSKMNKGIAAEKFFDFIEDRIVNAFPIVMDQFINFFEMVYFILTFNFCKTWTWKRMLRINRN